jgi:NAD(P)-dependent dehydrogenase (short-subunit alcohol dehydrogenase family)
MLNVNVNGVVYRARAAERRLVAQRRGRIVTIASQAGKVGFANWGAYCASKAAVVIFTQTLALEVAPYGVTANSICPGAMLTAMTRESIRIEAARAGWEDPDEMLAERGRALPLGRLGTPDDVGAMAAWLASDEASFTTGASFNLTGGESVFF